MRPLNRIELDRLFCWVLAICFSAVLIMSASALVIGLGRCIAGVIRGDPNPIDVHCHVSDIKHQHARLVCQSKNY